MRSHQPNQPRTPVASTSRKAGLRCCEPWPLRVCVQRYLLGATPSTPLEAPAPLLLLLLLLVLPLLLVPVLLLALLGGV